jgi:predicted NAD-dependent protein-ADP-ribosyltransferase YbiA (DUF1768 family)
MSEIKTSRHFMERRTDTHVYFLTGPGSNWYPTVFEQSLAPDRPPRLFNCREQYIMARKKLVCGDPAGAEAVMKVGPPDMRPILDLLRTDPTAALRQFHPFAKEQKRIGRTAPYDEAAWSADRPAAAYAGCLADSGQNPGILAWLMGTGDRMLVEGSDKDDVWAVKVRWDDPRILDAANWRGANLLGKTWVRTREFHVRNRHLSDAA